jgi:hypothetical protein
LQGDNPDVYLAPTAFPSGSYKTTIRDTKMWMIDPTMRKQRMIWRRDLKTVNSPRRRRSRPKPALVYSAKSQL